MGRFDRDITPASQACVISGDACAQSARRRRSRGRSARKRTRWLRAERRIPKTITAASRRRSLALRQGVKAAAQSAVFRDVAAAILVWARHGRCRHCQKKLRRRSPLAPEVKSFFMFSLQDLFAASRDRVKLGHSVPLSSVQIGTGCSTVQSPPVIETMPRGSAASTPEVAAAGLTRIMLPARNRRDDDIPAGAREKLEFVGQTRGWPRWRVENCAPRVGDATQTEQSSVTADGPTRPTPARRDRSVTKPASAIEVRGLLRTRVGMRSREFRVSPVSETLSRIIHVAAEFV